MEINSKGHKSIPNIKDILKLTKQIYEPLSKSHLLNLPNDSMSIDKSSIDKSDKSISINKSNSRLYQSPDKNGDTNINHIEKNLFTKNTGDIVNEIYFQNSSLNNKNKNIKKIQ